MNHIDFTLILSSALTPITLISGVGLLLLTMSARYDHTTARVRQLLHADEMTGGTDPHLAARNCSARQFFLWCCRPPVRVYSC